MNARSRPREGAANDLTGGSISTDSTARPRLVTLIGDERYHSLIAAGYQIAGTCRVCGAPLTNRRSVVAGVGPICGKRGAVND